MEQSTGRPSMVMTRLYSGLPYTSRICERSESSEQLMRQTCGKGQKPMQRGQQHNKESTGMRSCVLQRRHSMHKYNLPSKRPQMPTSQRAGRWRTTPAASPTTGTRPPRRHSGRSPQRDQREWLAGGMACSFFEPSTGTTCTWSQQLNSLLLIWCGLYDLHARLLGPGSCFVGRALGAGQPCAAACHGCPCTASVAALNGCDNSGMPVVCWCQAVCDLFVAAQWRQQRGSCWEQAMGWPKLRAALAQQPQCGNLPAVVVWKPRGCSMAIQGRAVMLRLCRAMHVQGKRSWTGRGAT